MDDSVGKVAHSCGDGAGGTRAGTVLFSVTSSGRRGQWPSSRYCSPWVRHLGTSCEELQEGLVTVKQLERLTEQHKVMGDTLGTNAHLTLCK